MFILWVIQILDSVYEHILSRICKTILKYCKMFSESGNCFFYTFTWKMVSFTSNHN